MSRIRVLPGLSLTCWLACTLLGVSLGAASPVASYYAMLGCRVVALDHLPVVEIKGRDFVSLALLDELSSAGTVPGRSTGSRAATGQPAKPAKASPEGGLQAPGWRRIPLAGRTLDIPLEGDAPSAKLDGKAVAALELADYAGHHYASAALLESCGLRLSFDPVEDLYQLAGLIYKVEYASSGQSGTAPPSLALTCITPVAVEGVQEDDERITLIADGGYMQDTPTKEYGGDPVLSKVGFKCLPGQGRTYIYLRQPAPPTGRGRTGFKIASDKRVGFARVSFGNYFQVAGYNKTSSGEISLNVQLGAPTEAKPQMAANPPRLVVDFPGAIFEDASQTIKVNQGSVQAIRIGSPVRGTVRVVLDLTGPLDYRVLSKDNGARYFIQLLPPTTQIATPTQLRKGRSVMVDAGHGGSDPGAPAVLSGIWEAPLTLKITSMLEVELRRLGYDVLSTRDANRFVSLGSRTDQANAQLPYVFVSVHCNSIEDPAFTGIMTFHHPSSTEGWRLAQLVHKDVLRSTGAVDKGVRTANFFVLRETVMPSVLVECGFLTNRDECARLIDPAYQRSLAAGIAQGVDEYITGRRD